MIVISKLLGIPDPSKCPPSPSLGSIDETNSLTPSPLVAADNLTLQCYSQSLSISHVKVHSPLPSPQLSPTCDFRRDDSLFVHAGSLKHDERIVPSSVEDDSSTSIGTD